MINYRPSSERSLQAHQRIDSEHNIRLANPPSTKQQRLAILHGTKEHKKPPFTSLPLAKPLPHLPHLSRHSQIFLPSPLHLHLNRTRNPQKVRTNKLGEYSTLVSLSLSKEGKEGNEDRLVRRRKKRYVIPKQWKTS